MADKKSFVMYASWATMIAGMPESQAGQLIKAICAHQTGKEYDIPDQTVSAIFSMIVEQMDADTDSYAEQCKKRAENAKRQWNQKNATHKNASAMQQNASAVQKDASASKKMHLHGDTESEYESESDKKINPPTPFTVGGVSQSDLEGLGCAPKVAEKLADWITNQAAKRQPITEMDLRSIVSRAKVYTSKHGVEAVCKVIEDSLQYKAIIWDRLDSKARDKPKPWQVSQSQSYTMDDLEQRLLAN